MTLSVALILAGRLPVEERRLNKASWSRIVSAFREAEKGLCGWEEPS